MSHHAPAKGGIVTPVTLILGVLVLIALYFLGQRFIYGLGAVTNINDGFPWGIWIAYDVVVGTALACGGYAVAILVYILNKGEYHPLVRPALLASALGYSLGGLSVIFDLGRYWNFWHIFAPGYVNTGSVMFEVAACIAAYVIVLWIEFSPAFLEKLGMAEAKKSLQKILFFIIGLGVLLPTMHQSSLGTLLVVFGYQIHPLWQTNLLPLLFLLSSVCMGYCAVVFEASLSVRAFNHPMDTKILSKLSKIVVGLLVAYLAIRIGDIAARGAFSSFRWDIRGLMFIIELICFALPIFLLMGDGAKSRRNLFLAAVFMLLAGFFYRIDAFLVAYLTGDGWNYFPAVSEIMVTVGIIALEVLAYIVLVRSLPVLSHAK